MTTNIRKQIEEIFDDFRSEESSALDSATLDDESPSVQWNEYDDRINEAKHKAVDQIIQTLISSTEKLKVYHIISGEDGKRRELVSLADIKDILGGEG